MPESLVVIYPVLSYLRRAATSFVFVRSTLLLAEEGQLWLRLERPTSYVDLATSTWASPASCIPMSELVVSGSSAESVAISATRRENEIADAIGAKDVVFTVAIGPEIVGVNGNSDVRRIRLAVIRGIFRAGPGLVLAEARTKASRVGHVSRRPLPLGVVVEKR